MRDASLGSSRKRTLGGSGVIKSWEHSRGRDVSSGDEAKFSGSGENSGDFSRHFKQGGSEILRELGGIALFSSMSLRLVVTGSTVTRMKIWNGSGLRWNDTQRG